jgi:hypothetical protein
MPPYQADVHRSSERQKKDDAAVNAARNIYQVGALADEPPKRTLRLTLRRVGKRKHPEKRMHAS